MKYSLVSGAMYSDAENKKVAYIKNSFLQTEKQVISCDSQEVLKVCTFKDSSCILGLRKYVIGDMKMNQLAVATPEYSKADHPDVCGWHLNRVAHVDHAEIYIKDKEYLLARKCCKHYELCDKSGAVAVSFSRMKSIGKWSIDAAADFEPNILCGLFLFCNFLEHENDLYIV